MNNIEKIINGDNLGQLSWEELKEDFSNFNELNNKGLEKYALVDFDWKKWEDLKEEYKNDSQRFWVISSLNKVFESYAIGYSLFAKCVSDKTTDRMERIFNKNTIKKAYLITHEQVENLLK
jgi:hypothetical protein